MIPDLIASATGLRIFIIIITVVVAIDHIIVSAPPLHQQLPAVRAMRRNIFGSCFWCCKELERHEATEQEGGYPEARG